MDALLQDLQWRRVNLFLLFKQSKWAIEVNLIWDNRKAIAVSTDWPFLFLLFLPSIDDNYLRIDCGEEMEWRFSHTQQSQSPESMQK